MARWDMFILGCSGHAKSGGSSITGGLNVFFCISFWKRIVYKIAWLLRLCRLPLFIFGRSSKWRVLFLPPAPCYLMNVLSKLRDWSGEGIEIPSKLPRGSATRAAHLPEGGCRACWDPKVDDPWPRHLRHRRSRWRAPTRARGFQELSREWGL